MTDQELENNKSNSCLVKRDQTPCFLVKPDITSSLNSHTQAIDLWSQAERFIPPLREDNTYNDFHSDILEKRTLRWLTKPGECTVMPDIVLNQALPVNIHSPLENNFDDTHNSRGKICRRFIRRNSYRSLLAPIDEDICTIVARNRSSKLCDLVFKNEYGIVQRLLSLGRSPNCYDDHKRTPLHIAVSKGYCKMVKLLLNHGADPNAQDGLGNTCLHLAACTNNVEMAMILIEGGASVHAEDIRGRSPIHLARSKLNILRRCPDMYVKSRVQQVVDMLVLYLQKNPAKGETAEEKELLSSFQNRLQITESPEQISNEIDNLGKVLNQMETLTIK